MGDKFVQILIVALLVVAILYYFGIMTFDFLHPGISSTNTEMSHMETVDPLDVGFANPKPNSTQLMETRGGRRNWEDGKFGSCTSHSCGQVEAFEAEINNTLGHAEPLRDDGGLIFTSTGDQIMIDQK
jgi:hypothetical protein